VLDLPSDETWGKRNASLHEYYGATNGPSTSQHSIITNKCGIADAPGETNDEYSFNDWIRF